MLDVRNITIRIDGATLLREVSASVRPGAVTVVVGPNGAGKSTLLRAASGEYTPAEGTVELEGTPLHHWRARDVAQRRAVLPQQSSLSFPFAVLDVVLMGRMPHAGGSAEPRDGQIAWAALEAVQVTHLAERLYPTLSGGEQQRVHMARAMAQIWEPPPGEGDRYLLLDEPTASLDLAHQHRLLELARGLAQEGTGVLIVLHDLNLAAQYADEVVLLHQGTVRAAGPPEHVLTPALIEATFEIPVVVTQHPCAACPLIVTRSPASIAAVNGRSSIS
jgi:iron complex transport system ATP-binding protein